MICQFCLAKQATLRVTQRKSSGQFEDLFYCGACCDALYVKRSSPMEIPRPRFTLKKVMILLGAWNVANAVVSWVMNSGHIPATPEQIRQSTVQTFVAVNLSLSFLTVCTFVLTWLASVMWYKRTGGLVPMPVQSMTLRKYFHVLPCVLPILAWSITAIFLE
jgi:hypothetical protein